MLHDPKTLKERRALPSYVARQVLKAAILTPDTDLVFLRNATAVLINYVFFERDEAGASLLLNNIEATPDAIHVAIELRKNQSRVTNTLSYPHSPRFSDSLVDLALCHDSLRRAAHSATK